MMLHCAKCMLVNERMDWKKPHVKWLSNRFYRLFREF